MATFYFVIKQEAGQPVFNSGSTMKAAPDKTGDLAPTTGFGNPYPKVGSYFTDNANTVATSANFNTTLFGQLMFHTPGDAGGVSSSCQIWSTKATWTGNEQISGIAPYRESAFDTGLSQEGSTTYVKYSGTWI